MTRPRFHYYWFVPELGNIAMFKDENGSDVDASHFEQEGKSVPTAPLYELWLKEVRTKKRCGRCYSYFRSVADMEHHYQVTTCGMWVKQSKANKI
jgi:hypothetical protein